MRKIIVFFLLLFLFPAGVFAQERGEGVGALTSKRSGEVVEVSDGKTAPRAEVVVENEAGELQAVAELDSKGVINFTFLTDPSNLNNLYMYARDEAGITNKLYITGTNISNFILPPTIIGVDDDNLPDNYLSVTGYTHPGAEISLQLTSNAGYSEAFNTESDLESGLWELIVEDLPEGSYTATAQATSEGVASEESQEITFVVGDEVITPTPPAEPADNISQNISEGIKQLPEPIKKTSNIISKLGILLLIIWFILKLIALGVGFFASIIYFWFVSIFRRGRQRWGVVYDSATKKYVQEVLVKLFKEDGVLVGADVTRRTGEFYLPTKPGSYRLEASKPGYIFPTQVIGVDIDGKYTNVYRGEIIKLQGYSTVALSIPVDPEAGDTETLRQLLNLLARYIMVLFKIILVPAIIFSVVTYINVPTELNLAVIIIYLLATLLLLASAFRK